MRLRPPSLFSLYSSLSLRHDSWHFLFRVAVVEVPYRRHFKCRRTTRTGHPHVEEQREIATVNAAAASSSRGAGMGHAGIDPVLDVSP
jgi:hypothetical protein